MLLTIRRICPQKNSAIMPNKVFASLLSDSNCFEADCVAEKDNVTHITKYNIYWLLYCPIHFYTNYELKVYSYLFQLLVCAFPTNICKFYNSENSMQKVV